MMDKKEQDKKQEQDKEQDKKQEVCLFDNTKINESLEALLKLMQEKESESKINIIVLDGRSGSGKTTIANALGTILKAGIIHMDDFFVPNTLRSKKRSNEVGGNIHYERFLKDVLPKIRQKEAFSYLKYNCLNQSFDDKQEVLSSKWRIVEGAYSTHPIFEKYYDLKVFCDIDSKEQIRRIILRNGKEKANDFVEKWIPLEEKYLEKFKILKDADLVFRNSRE